jgi:hypothetical protein
MKHHLRAAAFSLCLLLVATGCDESPKPTATPAPAASTTRAATATATASAAAKPAGPKIATPALDKIEATRGQGMGHPEAKPGVVKLAQAAMSCEWKEGDQAGFDLTCDAVTAWSESELVRGADGLYTLFHMLQDERKQVRWLAAKGLEKSDAAWGLTPSEAKRLVAAAKLEKDIGYQLGWTMAKIDFEDTQLGAAMMELLRGGGDVALRRGILTTSLYTNRDDDALFALYLELARKDANTMVRRYASGGLVNAGPDRRDAACKAWIGFLADDDPIKAGEAARNCADWSEDCSGHWDALLGGLDAAAKAGKVGSILGAQAVAVLLNKTKGAQKKRTLEVAKALIANAKNNGGARAEALRAYGEHGPDAKALAAKYVDDADASVKYAAKAISP